MTFAVKFLAFGACFLGLRLALEDRLEHEVSGALVAGHALLLFLRALLLKGSADSASFFIPGGELLPRGSVLLFAALGGSFPFLLLKLLSPEQVGAGDLFYLAALSLDLEPKKILAAEISALAAAFVLPHLKHYLGRAENSEAALSPETADRPRLFRNFEAEPRGRSFPYIYLLFLFASPWLLRSCF